MQTGDALNQCWSVFSEVLQNSPTKNITTKCFKLKLIKCVWKLFIYSHYSMIIARGQQVNEKPCIVLRLNKLFAQTLNSWLMHDAAGPSCNNMVHGLVITSIAYVNPYYSSMSNFKSGLIKTPWVSNCTSQFYLDVITYPFSKRPLVGVWSGHLKRLPYKFICY